MDQIHSKDLVSFFKPTFFSIFFLSTLLNAPNMFFGVIGGVENDSEHKTGKKRTKKNFFFQNFF